MNRLKKRIHSFCKNTADEILESATKNAEAISYKTMSPDTRSLLRSVAEHSMKHGEPAPDAYKRIVEQVFQKHVRRISNDIRIPIIVAALVMSKDEWASFHSMHIDRFLNYYSIATYSISKAYVATFVEVAKNRKRTKAKPAENSQSHSTFPNDQYEYED